ncbi:MAG: bacteriocin immunity protein [Candidatus Thermoplasmatota archaeon]
MKKTTLINYNEERLIDDYAYLASLPTAVFKENEKLYSHPLLFYQDQKNYDEKDKKATLDSRMGLDYFMEDWMSYCNGKCDQINLINVPKEKVTQWNSEEYVEIEEENIYNLANKIALNDWSYTENAVVSVLNDKPTEKNDKKISNKISKTLQPCKVEKEDTFSLEQTNSLNPVSKTFTVEDRFVYLKADCWWDGLLVANKMIPTGDPDVQLYCKTDKGWMQTVASSFWNIFSPVGHELAQAYVYNPGKWRVTVTDFPTEGEAPRRGIENIFEIQGALLKTFKRDIVYNVDITKYPGTHVTIPDLPSFGTRDAYFNLTWDNNNVNLGFSLIGPSGEAIYTSINNNEENKQKMHVNQLGESLENQNYKISVFALDDISRPIDFEIEYSWRQNVTKEEADSLTSATEGAVLASQLNAPLFYIKKDKMPKTTKNALYKLGVRNIHLVDINGRLKNDIKNQLKDVGEVKLYKDYRCIYDKIRELSGESQDVVFSTLDPWTKWYKEELKPGDETEAGLFVGPAAFSAAHHGTPVLFIDNHPELSQAVTYHNAFWRKHADERYDHKPSMAEMILTGNQIYDFLKEYDFDKKGKESIITVAGQYDIGVSWDRIFPGVANPGRIFGSPIDTATWISRNMFYPCLVFQNPAMQGSVKLINGSVSKRQVASKVGDIGEVITGEESLININIGHTVMRESGVEKYSYPVLCSFVTHKHRFNERASEYYGSKYQCADGLIPGETNTMEPIDQGVMKKFTGKEGMVFPDMTESEVVPFYLKKGGFNSVFSVALDPVVENLNNGVLLWIHGSHGLEKEGGSTLFWNPDKGFSQSGDKALIPKIINLQRKIAGLRFVGTLFSPTPGVFKEKNPWRGYEWYKGSTSEPDTMTMDIKGFLPYTNIPFPLLPATGIDWVSARKPVREFLNRIILSKNPDKPFKVNNLYDGVIGTLSRSRFQYVEYNSTEIEKNLENLHSAGFITSICQTSNTYFHLMLIRHGSVFQVQDPWPTSWYGAVWRQTIPRDIILGDTVGEAYTKGISHVAPLYIGEEGNSDQHQWWWDDSENVVYFGDPDIRMYVPDTEYSDDNHWTQNDVEPIQKVEELNLKGHMPFGVTIYPQSESPGFLSGGYIFIIILTLSLIILLISIYIYTRKK